MSKERQDGQAAEKGTEGQLPFVLEPDVKNGGLVTDLVLTPDIQKELLAMPEEERKEALTALAEDLLGNLDFEEPEFPQIKILHSAALFETPRGDKEEAIEGVMIEILPARAWWEPKADQERVPPDCSSRTWLQPDSEAPKHQAKTCAECKWNVWGSAVDPTGAATRGKACRMRKRIFLQQEGHEIPYVLSVPPMSLKALRKYLVDLSDRGIQKNRCVTEFYLELKEDGVQQYSVLSFKSGRELNLAEYKKAREKRDNYLSSMKAIQIDVEEFLAEEEIKEEIGTGDVAHEPDTTGQDTTGKDDLPF